MRATAPALALSTCVCALGGCSWVVDFAGDLGDAAPASPPDARTIDAATTCEVMEPNDELDSAWLIDAGSFSAAICPEGDLDFYGFSVDGNQDAIIEIRFDNAAGFGDLDMLLFSRAGTQLLPRGNGFGDVERIERTLTSEHGRLPAGDYAVLVFAFDNLRENDYVFELLLDPDPAGAADAAPTDGAAPDASPAADGPSGGLNDLRPGW